MPTSIRKWDTGWNLVKKPLKIAVGLILVIVGLIALPLPIPAGLLMLIIGLSLLVSAIPETRNYLRRMRGRFRQTSAMLDRIKHRVPRFARQLIEDTDPDSQAPK